MKEKEDVSGGKTVRLMGLFMAAALVATSGCGTASTAQSGHIHIDNNNDGYCDEDGARMNGRSGWFFFPGSGYYGGTTGKSAISGTESNSGNAPSISSGSAPKAGIGSGATGGGG